MYIYTQSLRTWYFATYWEESLYLNHFDSDRRIAPFHASNDLNVKASDRKVKLSLSEDS